MTVCAALKHGNKIFVATDSRVNQGDSYKDLDRDKFLRLPDEGVLIAICGEMRIEQLIERMLKEVENAHHLFITGQDAVLQLGDVILNGLRSYFKNDDIIHMRETQLLIVSEASDRIYVMDSDFTVSEYSSFAAIGSGADAAEASLMTALRFGKTGKNALQTAMEVACGCVSTCGGQIWMNTMKLDLE